MFPALSGAAPSEVVLMSGCYCGGVSLRQDRVWRQLGVSSFQVACKISF